jgi:hypothetical protein
VKPAGRGVHKLSCAPDPIDLQEDRIAPVGCVNSVMADLQGNPARPADGFSRRIAEVGRDGRSTTRSAIRQELWLRVQCFARVSWPERGRRGALGFGSPLVSAWNVNGT